MIRSARVADAAAVGGLKVRAWRAAYGGFLSPLRLDDQDGPGVPEIRLLLS